MKRADQIWMVYYYGDLCGENERYFSSKDGAYEYVKEIMEDITDLKRDKIRKKHIKEFVHQAAMCVTKIKVDKKY
jgi:hypothetical protein